jgi:hypothetical protein
MMMMMMMMMIIIIIIRRRRRRIRIIRIGMIPVITGAGGTIL